MPCTAANSATEKGKPGSSDLPEEMCKISINDPHPACAESARVIKTLKHMAELLSRGDFKAYSEYLADGCTTFDEGTGKLIVGKEAVLADMKKRITDNNPDGREHMLTLTIEDPYAKVTGDVAVVTFKAIKQVGGAHPEKEEISATDVFVKRGNKWQKLHFRGEWKKIG
jgi:ketosteroid isomerase-like protein